MLKFFESADNLDTGYSTGVGLTILKAVYILANGEEQLVDCMTSCNLTSVLIRCLDLFISQPPPGMCGCGGVSVSE